MKRTLKILAIVGAGALALFAVAIFIFYRLLQVGEFRRFLIAEFEQRTGLKVTVGEARIEVGRTMGVSFRDFVLTEPESDRPLIAAPKVLVRVAFVPLLQRKLQFHALRLSQPMLHVDRDREGRIPLAELIVNLPFQSKEGAQFSLDLREIRIDKGSIAFTDYLGGKGPVVTRFRDIDLNLRRARARELGGPVSPGKGNAPATGTAQAGLDFRWKAIVQRNGREADFAMNGKAVFSGGSFDLREAWLDVELNAESLPAAMLWEYYQLPLPATSARGKLGYRIHWQGRLAEGARLAGEVRFQGLEVDGRGVFPGVLAPGDGKIELSAEWKPQELHLERLDFQSKALRLSVQGVVRELDGGDPYVDLRLTTPFIAVGTARQYLPKAILDSPRLQALAAALTLGEVRLDSARFTGRLSELRRLSEPGHEQRLSVDAEFRDAGGSLAGESSLPLRSFSGRLVLEKGTLHYRNVKGAVGQSRLEKIEGSHTGIFSKRGALDLRIAGEVELAQLPELAKLGMLPSARESIGSALGGVGGKGRLNLRLQTDFAARTQVQGDLALDGARLSVADLSLTQVKGKIVVATGELRVERATALFAGSPIQLRGSLKIPAADPATFDVTIDSAGVKAGEALRLLLDLDPALGGGTVRGTLRYQGSVASAERRRISGTLELVGAQVPLKVFAQPLREVYGRVRVDGKAIDLQNIKGRLAGYPFSFSGRWMAGDSPELTFELTAPQMDIAYLLPKGEGGEADWYERFRARGKIAIGRGRYENFVFSDLKTDLTVDKKSWRLENFFARSDGGTVRGGGVFVDGGDKLRILVSPDIEGVPLKTLFGWLDIEQTEIIGKASLKGTFELNGATGAERKRSVDGAFQLRIEDGMARRLRLLVRVISVLDLTRWFTLKMPDLTQEGIHFRSVTADFRVLQGVYATENLLVDSDELRISGAGTMDGPKGELNFVIAVRPFPGLETAVNYIPLIGRGLAAIKNSLLVASFNVRGPLDDPTITPAPLSTLSEFFFGALSIPKSLVAPAPDGKK
jgi:uncharacterized protein YhdP